MRKKFLYIKPINLVDQKEDKIIRTIPIKTKESFNHFTDKSNQNIDLNENYFEIISKKNISNKVIYQHPFDNFNKNNYINNNNNSTTRNKKKKAHLKDVYKFNSSENCKFKTLYNEKNLISKNKNIEKMNNPKKEKYSSLTLNDNNHSYQISNEETMKQILKPRKNLHNIYNQNKRIFNYSYNKLSSTFTLDKNNYKEKPKETNKNTNNSKKYKNKLNKKVSKKINKNETTESQIKFGLYDPASKTLRYKHYTEFRKFNKPKIKIQLLINQNKQKDEEILFNANNNISDINEHLNTNYQNDINFMNQSLQKHKLENLQNLAKLKKLLFKKKIDNKYINKPHEESKSNNDYQNEKKIFNEKMKKIINNERKKLDESINDYNKKLKINLNKKDVLFKNLNKNKYLCNLTEINRNKFCENEDNLDNTNLLTDFHFDRNNKY